jgi:hypothetical protein
MSKGTVMISRQILTIILTFAGIIFGAALATAIMTDDAASIDALVISLLVFLGAALAYAFATREKGTSPAQEKRKRVPYADVYGLIDRLVDELDTDEVAYLRRRLDEHADTAPSDAVQTLEMLLDERQQRLSGH